MNDRYRWKLSLDRARDVRPQYFGSRPSTLLIDRVSVFSGGQLALSTLSCRSMRAGGCPESGPSPKCLAWGRLHGSEPAAVDEQPEATVALLSTSFDLRWKTCQ